MGNYKDHIEINPKIMLGKPVVRGTRLTVELVLQKMADGYSKDELLDMYPNLKQEDIIACIGYAAKMLASAYVQAA